MIDFLQKVDRLKGLGSDGSDGLPLRSNQYLLRACIKYLSVPEMEAIPFVFSSFYREESEAPITSGIEDFHFLAYSLAHWVDHYTEAEKGGESQSWQIKDFADARQGHFFWYRLYCQVFAASWDREDPPFASFAAEHKLYGYIEDCYLKDSVEDTDGGEFGGPLQAAVVSGDREMVRLLINGGVDVNARGGRFGTALAAAITFRHLDIIDLLRRHGADIELSTPQPPAWHGYWCAHRNAFSRSRAPQNSKFRPASPPQS